MSCDTCKNSFFPSLISYCETQPFDRSMPNSLTFLASIDTNKKKISCSLACKPYPRKLTKHYWSIALFLSFGFLFSMISFHVEDKTNHFTISALSMLLQGKVFDMDQLVCGTSASHKTTNKKLKQFLWRMYICFCTLLIHGACIRCLFLLFFFG